MEIERLKDQIATYKFTDKDKKELIKLLYPPKEKIDWTCSLCTKEIIRHEDFMVCNSQPLCFHFFHEKCMDEQENKKRCPRCRVLWTCVKC